jgi:hypothetical protein
MKKVAREFMVETGSDDGDGRATSTMLPNRR